MAQLFWNEGKGYKTFNFQVIKEVEKVSQT